MKSLQRLRDDLNPIKHDKRNQVFSVIKNLHRRKIDLDVYLPTIGKNLQRDYVWTLLQKRELIMSILLERLIPPLYVISIIVNEDEILQVIDGKQRLSTMIDFYNNKFSIVLEDQEFYYKFLPYDYQFAIANYFIMSYTVYDDIDNPITDKEKINWFKAINFSGTEQDITHLKSLHAKKNK